MISGFCEQGKHGRCNGWMVVPAYGDLREHNDISVACRCKVCKHPPVDPDRHLKNPEGASWTSNT